jgi:hypothetical protein
MRVGNRGRVFVRPENGIEPWMIGRHRSELNTSQEVALRHDADETAGTIDDGQPSSIGFHQKPNRIDHAAIRFDTHRRRSHHL